MDINVGTVQDVTVVKINGDIDGKTAPQVKDQVSALLQPDAKILLDMSEANHISSAGFRMLLTVSRQVQSSEGHLVLVGVNERIKETMSMTGFLRLFTFHETVEDGLAVLE